MIFNFILRSLIFDLEKLINEIREAETFKNSKSGNIWLSENALYSCEKMLEST